MRRTLEGVVEVLVMLLGTNGLDSVCGALKITARGGEGGEKAAAEIRDEKRGTLTSIIRQRRPSRLMSVSGIKVDQVRQVAMVKIPRFACTAVLPVHAPYLRHA